MPAIIYGTAWKKQRTTELVLEAFVAGFRGVDTACQPKHYDEVLVGNALQQLEQQGIARSDYYLQTKFTPPTGQDASSIPYDANASIAEQVAQSFSRSQQNLQTDYVDGLILHSPFEDFGQTLSAWRAMENIYQQGDACRLGISNCYSLEVLQALYNDAEVKPAIVQNQFYRQTGFDIAIRQWCGQQNIVYQSFWTLSANAEILGSKTIMLMEKKYQLTPAQLLFSYLHKKGVVPLTGSTSRQHMDESLASINHSFNTMELAALDTLI